jgi:protein TonB
MFALALLTVLAAPQDPGTLPETTLPDVVAEAPLRGGRVVLSCVVQSNGALNDCQVVSETPRGAGLGARVLEGARRARTNPGGRGGDSGGRVTFTVHITPPSAAPTDR